MESIGESSKELFYTILAQEPYNWYRSVSGILSLQKLYSNNVIELACKRALGFGITGYRQIKSICQSGSYNLPMDLVEKQVYNDNKHNNIEIENEVANG